MKAWVLSDKTGRNHYSNLVWAKSAGKANESLIDEFREMF